MAQMHNLHQLTRDARSRSHKLLAIYLTCGYLERDWTVQLARDIFEAGADFIELGMPFSDPLADGPTIQAASQHALDHGTGSNEYFDTAAQLSELGPTVFMGYLNSVMSIPDFLRRAQAAQICGLILPEWPVHSDSFHKFELQAASLNVPRVPFIAPTTPPERVAQIDALDAPFVYAVSITGVTGARTQLASSTDHYLANLGRTLSSPVMAGFGVSTPETAKRFASYTNGVIVGSALLDGIRKAGTLPSASKFVRDFVSSLRTAIDEPIFSQELS